MAEEQGPSTATAGEVPESLRSRMVLALDVDDLVVARRLAQLTVLLRHHEGGLRALQRRRPRRSRC